MTTKRRWGYWVWAIGATVILVPELIAAFDSGWLPFTTISTMTGHLERRHDGVELVVVAVLVWVVYSTVRAPARPRSGAVPSAHGTQPARTGGGRLTLHVPASPRTTDDDGAPPLFWLAVVIALAVIALASFAAATWWTDVKPHYHVSYVLYGLLALIWIVIPSVLAFGFGKDVPFPTFYRTVVNLEDWLASRNWRHSLGPTLAWLVSYLILAGLVILLLHLTLYPFPNITRILNPGG